YFGGFRSLGTLYWENEKGIAATAAILGATAANGHTAADSAHRLIRQYGITHLVFFSWNTFATEYARLARGSRLPRDPAADADALSSAFAVQLLRDNRIPPWL